MNPPDELQLAQRLSEIATQINRPGMRPDPEFTTRMVSRLQADFSKSGFLPKPALKWFWIGIAALIAIGVTVTAVRQYKRWSRAHERHPLPAQSVVPTSDFGAKVSTGSEIEPFFTVSIEQAPGKKTERGQLTIGIPMSLVFKLRGAGPHPSTLEVRLPKGVEFYSLKHPTVREQRVLRLPLEWQKDELAMRITLVIRGNSAGGQILHARLLDRNGAELRTERLVLCFESVKGG